MIYELRTENKRERETFNTEKD